MIDSLLSQFESTVLEMKLIDYMIFVFVLYSANKDRIKFKFD